MTGGVGRILNNSILEATPGGRIPGLLCLSGSDASAVGQWIGPSGRVLTTVQNDPFDVIVGDSGSPGELRIETPGTNPPITAIYEGVYTCEIPDDADATEDLHVGIYLSGSSG